METSYRFLYKVSPSIGLTNLAKPYHVHYHLSQPDMAGRLRRCATRRAAASVQRFVLLADVRGNQGLPASSLQFTSPLEFNAIFRDGFPLRVDPNG